MNPSLIVALLIVALLLAVFLPHYGLRAWFEKWRRSRQREQVEDALKFLLDREQEGRHASLEALAGTLGISRTAAFGLLERMEAQSLITSHTKGIHLTPDGERWALHMIRAHRLWERYLADEARMPLQDIHREAHRREHTMSAAQLDELEAALGHPSHDPHGDPIPTRAGELPRSAAVPITDWQTDRPALVVHLEDEPPIAYQQILAAGLGLGQVVRILESEPGLVVLSDGESEYRLAPAVAANVHVTPLPEEAHPPSDAITLDELRLDQRAEVVALDQGLQGFTRRRFLDLGLTPGVAIYPELDNFFGEPRAYRVRNTLIALRDDQAAKVWVKPVG
jgi:DtxR family Mn-dependent transcriptional regulator